MLKIENRLEVYKEAEKIWKGISAEPQLKGFIKELELHQKLLNIFHTGDFYHYLFNVRKMEFAFISPEMPGILDYPMEMISMPFFLSIIHPDDIPYFMSFESQVVQFFNNLPNEKIGKYKVRYDYRVKKGNGEYMRLLHQMLTIIPDESGMPVHSFCVHTDITYLKPSGTPLLSFIGLEGEPSYIDIGHQPVLNISKERISKREKEIVTLLAKGYSSQKIADELFIARSTVDSHRKNILHKTASKSTSEVIAQAITKGWI
ncbi:LuxR C-terminal-related transcriptional regulator [Pedobacter psychroterrae]|nr:LuxR C-terminal-related transcriptional regulator [Pedobacter psychroterrae]